MPPAVIDTMLFDGEKIAQIIDDNQISGYLKEMINVNFNLNIFEKMEDDINFYILKEKSRKTLGHRIKKIERGRANFNEVYGAYKKGAKNRGYDFELTKKQFEEVITKPCIYCGEEKRVHYHKQYSNGAFEYTGLDRYDNSKGYTIDNVVSCCSICNRMKSNMDTKEFEEKIDQISARKDMWKRTG